MEMKLVVRKRRGEGIFTGDGFVWHFEFGLAHQMLESIFQK
jgi:hypothetical protein